MENLQSQICTKCNIKKPISEFYKKTKLKYRRDCKECNILQKMEKYYETPMEERPRHSKEYVEYYNEKNKDKII